MINLDERTVVRLKALPPERLEILQSPDKKSEIVNSVNEVFNLPFLDEGQEKDILGEIYDLVIPQLRRAEDLLNPTVKAMVVSWVNSRINIPHVPEKWEGLLLGYIYDWVGGAVIAELKPYLDEHER